MKPTDGLSAAVVYGPWRTIGLPRRDNLGRRFHPWKVGRLWLPWRWPMSGEVIRCQKSAIRGIGYGCGLSRMAGSWWHKLVEHLFNVGRELNRGWFPWV